MNRRQTIVLWISTILLCLTSISYGIEYESMFYAVALPVILGGGLLIFQLRDRASAANEAASPAGAPPKVLLPLLLLMSALLVHQLRASEGIQDSMNSVSVDLDQLKSELDMLQFDVDQLR